MLPELTEDNCEKLTFTEEICNDGYCELQIFAGPKMPLPISAIISAEEISARSPII